MTGAQRLYFEGRDVSKDTDHVETPRLKVGKVYFKVGFVDRQSTIPVLTPLVFAGRDLEGSGLGELYFQDCESYGRGVRFGTASSSVFETFLESEGSGVFEFNEALNCLLRCSLLRRE